MRAIAFRVCAGADSPRPTYDLSSLVNFRIGHDVHNMVQQALLDIDPRWVIEADVKFPAPYSAMISGHADAWHPDEKIVLELKTVGAYAYDRATGIQRSKRFKASTPEGPKFEHILQCALNGYGLGAEWLVIGYVAKEAVSIKMAESNDLDEIKRIYTDWWFPMADVKHLAEAELERIAQLYNVLGNDLDPNSVPTEIMGSDLVPRPITPHTVWNCDYCSYEGECI